MSRRLGAERWRRSRLRWKLQGWNSSAIRCSRQGLGCIGRPLGLGEQGQRTRVLSNERPNAPALLDRLLREAAMLEGVAIAKRRARALSAAVHSATVPAGDDRGLARRPPTGLRTAARRAVKTRGVRSVGRAQGQSSSGRLLGARSRREATSGTGSEGLKVRPGGEEESFCAWSGVSGVAFTSTTPTKALPPECTFTCSTVI